MLTLSSDIAPPHATSQFLGKQFVDRPVPREWTRSGKFIRHQNHLEVGLGTCRNVVVGTFVQHFEMLQFESGFEFFDDGLLGSQAMNPGVRDGGGL